MRVMRRTAIAVVAVAAALTADAVAEALNCCCSFIGAMFDRMVF